MSTKSCGHINIHIQPKSQTDTIGSYLRTYAQTESYTDTLGSTSNERFNVKLPRGLSCSDSNRSRVAQATERRGEIHQFDSTDRIQYDEFGQKYQLTDKQRVGIQTSKSQGPYIRSQTLPRSLSHGSWAYPQMKIPNGQKSGDRRLHVQPSKSATLNMAHDFNMEPGRMIDNYEQKRDGPSPMLYNYTEEMRLDDDLVRVVVEQCPTLLAAPPTGQL